MAIELSIIILNWHAADDTIRCIKHIRQWRKLQPRIWVVDNASTDDSVLRIKEQCPKIDLIINDENLGFAGGTNRGLEAVLQQYDHPILLLNNDAFIEENDLQRLYQTLSQSPEAGFIVPLLFDADHQLISAGGKNPVLHFQTRVTAWEDASPILDVDCVSGTSVLIKAEVFRKVGLFNERYFFSTELADLCYRAKQAGYRCLVDTRARAFHDVQRSSDLRPTLHTYYIIRNRFLFLQHYHLISRGFLFSFWSLYSLVLSLKLGLGPHQGTARAARLAVLDAWQNRFGGQNERVLAYVGS